MNHTSNMEYSFFKYTQPKSLYLQIQSMQQLKFELIFKE